MEYEEKKTDDTTESLSYNRKDIAEIVIPLVYLKDNKDKLNNLLDIH